MQKANDFLHDLVNNQTAVFVYLINGIKLQGIITAFDDHSILLSSHSDQLVFKHAISSIIPLSR